MAGPADFFNSLDSAPASAPSGSGRIDVYQGETPKSSGPASFFDQFSAQEQLKAPTHGVLETAGLHGVHGITSGFSDELAGLGAVSGANRPTLNPIDLMHGLARMGYEKLTGGHEASDEYTKARDERRKALEESQAEHPIVATGADIAGSMALPGGSALRGPTLAARALRGAGVGAVQGAFRGAGEAPEASDIPKSATVGAGLGATLGAPFNAVLGPRVMSAAKQDIIDAANKYGVQLPFYMVTDHPVWQAAGENLSHLPMVGSKLKEAGQRATEGIQNIKEGLTGPGTPSELRVAGSDTAKAAQKNFIDQNKKISEQNYNAVNAALPNPNARQAPFAIWQEAGDQLNKVSQYGGKPGPILQQIIDAANVPGGLTYEALKDLRTNLYTKWNSMQGKADTTYADYAGALSAITKDMEDIVKNQGGQRALQLWQKANAQHSANKALETHIESAIGTGIKDTSAADSIFNNINSAKPNIGAVAALKNTMHPSEWEQIQASVLGRMGSNESGGFSIQKLLSADAKMPPAGRDLMFGRAGTPRRDAYDAILTLGKAVTNVEQFRNRSMTAPFMVGAGAALGIYEDLTTGNPWHTAGEIGAGTVLASILARPATAKSATNFSKALSKYLGTPSSWVAGKVPKAVETAARNFAITYANQEGLDKDKVINSFVSATPLWSKQ